MEPYRAETTLGKSGELILTHVPFKAGEKVEVIVTAARKAAKGWPEGYFESTFGAIKDETFMRHPV